jgi:hypothetical protein
MLINNYSIFCFFSFSIHLFQSKLKSIIATENITKKKQQQQRNKIKTKQKKYFN